MFFALAVAMVIHLPSTYTHVDVPNPPGSTVEVLELGRGPVVNGFTTLINVVRKRYDDTPALQIGDWAAEAINDLQAHEGVKIVDNHKLVVCDINSWWIESTGSYNGRDLDLVQQAFLDGGYEYIATYSRPAGTPADPDAIKSLTTMCPL